MPKKFPGPGGFTLVECLVAVAVLALGGMAAIWLHIAAMRINTRATYLSVASSLAISEIERLHHEAQDADGFDNITDIATDPAGQPPPEFLNRRGELQNNQKDGPFTRETRYYPHRPTKKSHQVEVKVSWKEGSGSRYYVIYTTALTYLP